MKKTIDYINREDTIEAIKTQIENHPIIEEVSKLADVIPYVCECCIGCEMEKKNGECDNTFILSLKRTMQYLIKSRWIPVSERLPEDKERVLIFYWLSTKPKTPWYKVATFSTKLCNVDEYDLYGKDHPGFYGFDSEYGYYEHTDVEYWMPLPPPPKESEKDD